MIDYGVRIVLSDYTATSFLYMERCLPGFVDVSGWILLELRNPLSDIVPVFVFGLEKGHRRVYLPILMKEGRGRQPHPVCIIQGIVSIKEVFVENISTSLPMKPKVSSSHKTSN
jgi:hypothetical protein